MSLFPGDEAALPIDPNRRGLNEALREIDALILTHAYDALDRLLLNWNFEGDLDLCFSVLMASKPARSKLRERDAAIERFRRRLTARESSRLDLIGWL